MSKQDMWAVFGTNKKKETDGVTFEYPGGIRVLLARAGGGNSAFGKAYEHNMRPYKRQESMGIMPDDKKIQVVHDTYIDSVIRDFQTNVSETDTPDWQSVIKWPDGSTTPADKANLRKLFVMLPDLFQQIVADSGDLATFRKEELEEDVKN